MSFWQEQRNFFYHFSLHFTIFFQIWQNENVNNEILTFKSSKMTFPDSIWYLIKSGKIFMSNWAYVLSDKNSKEFELS